MHLLLNPMVYYFERYREIFPEVTEWSNTKIFFKASSPDFDLPFDMFSAAFYLITRYEEYENSIWMSMEGIRLK